MGDDKRSLQGEVGTVCLLAQCIQYYDSFSKDWIKQGMVVHSYNPTTGGGGMEARS